MDHLRMHDLLPRGKSRRKRMREVLNSEIREFQGRTHAVVMSRTRDGKVVPKELYGETALEDLADWLRGPVAASLGRATNRTRRARWALADAAKAAMLDVGMSWPIVPGCMVFLRRGLRRFAVGGTSRVHGKKPFVNLEQLAAWLCEAVPDEKKNNNNNAD